MTLEERYIEASEKYETLYWAWEAKQVIGDADELDPTFTSTLPGSQGMGEWEFAQLRKQVAAAPEVTAKQVAAAKTAANRLYKALKTPKRQRIYRAECKGQAAFA